MQTGEQLPVTLGRYRLLARIAAGGMGAVYLARASGELGFSRVVAVKLLHPHLAEDEETVRRFLDEARVAARVVHPHVVTVLDVVSAEDRVFLVLEYVHGESLAGLLRAASKEGVVPPLGVVSAIVHDALEGLHAAHEATDDRGAPLGVVHRDISPQNILVSARGASYVTDFGIAKVKDRLRNTRTGEMVGKAGYMAPEQISGGVVTRATDLYAAGIVLWEACTGKRLFEGLEQQIEATVRKKTPPAPSSVRPEVPKALDDLVMNMLSLRPEARPKTALEAARALAVAMPPATSSEVAEWVADLAGPNLERMDVALREPLEAPASAGTVAGTVAPATDTLVSHTSVSRWRRRAQASFGAAAGALAVAAVLGFVVARGARANLAAAPAAPATSTDAAVVEVETASTSTSTSTPTPTSTSTSTPTPTPTSTSTSTKPATHAVRHAPAVDCSTPFVVVDGIKRYKRECFKKGSP